MRVVIKVAVKFYSCNNGRLTNKMAILAHDVQKHKLDVIHIYVLDVHREQPLCKNGESIRTKRRKKRKGI